MYVFEITRGGEFEISFFKIIRGDTNEIQNEINLEAKEISIAFFPFFLFNYESCVE